MLGGFSQGCAMGVIAVLAGTGRLGDLGGGDVGDAASGGE